MTIDLDVLPLTTGRWCDLEAVFNGRGCSVARGCWCMYYRISGKNDLTRPGGDQRTAAKDALQSLTGRGPAPGLIGYRDKTPVGWVSLGPRETFAKLRRSPVMKPVDTRPVWSVVCFVVPSPYRKQGIARQLLAAAIDYARAQGGQCLEAYPVDKAQANAANAAWFGSKRMFDDAGFQEVARRRQDRPVMRLELTTTDPV